mgnify:CR=1 FL=1
MKLSCIATAAFLFATSINVQAHDFWLEPTAYRSQEPNSLALQFKVGHKEDTSHWNLAWDRIVALRTYSFDGVTDMAASVVPKTSMLPGMAKTTAKAAQVAEIMALFDVVIESSKVNIRKPDPAIYKMTCEQMSLRPEDTIYLDDLGINLKPARALGMTTIKVLNADQALKELEALLNMSLR